jgi:hypothetical protein
MRPAPVPTASATPGRRAARSCRASRKWTASITRCCTGLLLSAALLAGCGLVGGSERFELQAVEVRSGGAWLDIRLDQALELSDNARSALLNGVPLVLRLDLEIRDAQSQTPLAVETRHFELRYLPMSERFELTGPGADDRRSYPRLRHVLRHLSDLRLRIDSPGLTTGDYALHARLRLDRTRLPAPMQLPSIVYRDWRHDTDWSQWPFRISA